MADGAGGSAGGGTTREELAELVTAAGRWPIVTVLAAGGRLRVTAAMLAWGRAVPDGGWMAGVAFLEPAPYAGGRRLVTMWLRADQVRPHPDEDYRQVPRVTLVGRVADWPALPPCYPQLTEEWRASHRHVNRH